MAKKDLPPIYPGSDAPSASTRRSTASIDRSAMNHSDRRRAPVVRA